MGDSRIAKMDCHENPTDFLAMTEKSVDCFGDKSPRNDGLFDSANRPRNDESLDCHESAIADSRNDEFFVNHHESSAILLRYAPIDFTPQKICKKEYFLQIKDKYEFGDGFVIYVVFGAYYAPNSAYIIVRKNSEYCEILGDIIPTKANLSALNELQFLGS